MAYPGDFIFWFYLCAIAMNTIMMIRRRRVLHQIHLRRRQLFCRISRLKLAAASKLMVSQVIATPFEVLRVVPPRFRKTWMKARSTHFSKNILPQMDDDEYLEMFRMKKTTFQMLCKELKSELEPHPHVVFREPLSVEKKIAVALYKLASCCEYRVVGNVFGIHKSTVHKCFYGVVRAINRVLLPKYINMPNDYEAQEIASYIKLKTGFPQVIGAIDGTHIPILPPKEGYRDYVNRKGWPSLILQGVVDHLYRFRDISINFPGSCHDAVAFKHSNLFKRSNDLIPKGLENIEGKNIPFMLLGDPAYPLLDWLMKPYIGVLSPEEESFNCYLSSSRIIIENAFGRLKARWRCLLKRVDIKYSFVPKVVSACCVLHNIVETNKETFIEQWLHSVEEAEIVIPQPKNVVNKESTSDSKANRDHLKQYFARNFPLLQSATRL